VCSYDQFEIQWGLVELGNEAFQTMTSEFDMSLTNIKNAKVPHRSFALHVASLIASLAGAANVCA
jgi:hypothetical protein